MSAKEILLEISNECEQCPLHEKCIEEECVLYRIEKIVEELGWNNEKN